MNSFKTCLFDCTQCDWCGVARRSRAIIISEVLPGGMQRCPAPCRTRGYRHIPGDKIAACYFQPWKDRLTTLQFISLRFLRPAGVHIRFPQVERASFTKAELSALSPPNALKPSSDWPVNARGLVMMGWSNSAISQQLLPVSSERGLRGEWKTALAKAFKVQATLAQRRACFVAFSRGSRRRMHMRGRRSECSRGTERH